MDTNLTRPRREIAKVRSTLMRGETNNAHILRRLVNLAARGGTENSRRESDEIVARNVTILRDFLALTLYRKEAAAGRGEGVIILATDVHAYVERWCFVDRNARIFRLIANRPCRFAKEGRVETAILLRLRETRSSILAAR